MLSKPLVTNAARNRQARDCSILQEREGGIAEGVLPKNCASGSALVFWPARGPYVIQSPADLLLHFCRQLGIAGRAKCLQIAQDVFRRRHANECARNGWVIEAEPQAHIRN